MDFFIFVELFDYKPKYRRVFIMKKLFKKLTVLFLSIILFSGSMQITAFAEATSKKSSISTNSKLKKSLSELEKNMKIYNSWI